MRTDESYLRWKFAQPVAKGYAPNVKLLDGDKRPDSVVLGPGESPVAQIELQSGGSLLVTNARLIGPDETIVRFAEVRYCDWIDRDRTVAARLKASKYGRIIFEMSDGGEIVFDGLGQAVFPLLKFFWFKLRFSRPA
jgi:hypothetical protein